MYFYLIRTSKPIPSNTTTMGLSNGSWAYIKVREVRSGRWAGLVLDSHCLNRSAAAHPHTHMTILPRLVYITLPKKN